MPQRRMFAPEPMDKPQLGHTGRAMTPPNLSPAPKPLPPPQPATPPTLQPGAGQPGQPGQGAAPPSASGPGQLPSSIPLRPPQPAPQPGQVNPIGNGTVTPFNANQFIGAQSGAAAPAGPGQGGDAAALMKLLAGLGHTGEPPALDDGQNNPGY